MDVSAIMMHSFWAGLFATGLAGMLSAPIAYLIPSFVCGFAGRCVRDICVAGGLSLNWATVIAALMVVLIAAAIIRRRTVSPVVLICGVLPLGAAVAMFNLIFALMRVSASKGAALSADSAALNVNFGEVFVTSLSIVVGLGAGMAIARLFRREEGLIE
jgi:hypothetical protein